MNDKTHWETIYATKAPDQVSWYQVQPQQSLDLIRRAGVGKSARIIDVGAGESALVDNLLSEGYTALTMLDISPTALQQTKARLGDRAEGVEWIEADITRCVLPESYYDLWHDRAVFHFLTRAEDRQGYIACVKRSLRPGGYIIVASFAQDGPTMCSGLNVVRYSPERLHHEFGETFELLESHTEDHHTPFGTQQKFIYCYCKKR